MTITYGSTAGGGPGATAPTTAAARPGRRSRSLPRAGRSRTSLHPQHHRQRPDRTLGAGLSFGSFTNASVTGTTVYIRQGTAGGFTVTGTSNDPESGIDHLTFPGGFGAGWTGGGADSSSFYTSAYTFSAAATRASRNKRDGDKRLGA